jgi:hypothetical protein
MSHSPLFPENGAGAIKKHLPLTSIILPDNGHLSILNKEGYSRSQE